MTITAEKIAQHIESASNEPRPWVAKLWAELIEKELSELGASTRPRYGIDLGLNDPETDFALGLSAGDERLLCAVLYEGKGEPN